MLKKIFGVLAGMVAAIIVIMLVQMVSSKLYPMPEGLGLNDKEGLAAFMNGLPITAFLLVILSYILGSLAGGYVSAFVSKAKFLPALIVGGLLTIAGVMNAVAMPQPIWVSIISLISFIPMAWIGARLAKSV